MLGKVARQVWIVSDLRVQICENEQPSDGLNHETLADPDGFDNLGPAISVTNRPVILDM